MTKLRVVHAFSAGGVVYRPLAPAAPVIPSTPDATDGVTGTITESTPNRFEIVFEIVLVGHPEAGPVPGLWVLPKGTPRAGETPEETARREVREETGIVPRIVGELGTIHYWFTRKSVRYSKEVQHFLMEAVGGDVAQHDHEYAEARWFPLSEAIARLAHENEADVVRRAERLLTERFTPQGQA
jgi:8-oxo-dGTP pyrophosphatase MutT (NUDIX family)